MEIIINKDIRNVKTKDIWIFSWKQAGFLAIALAVGGGIILLEKKVFHFKEINYLIPLIPMVIPLLFGFLRPFGMSFWQFLRTYVNEAVIKPKVYNASYDSEEDISLDYEELINTYGIEYFTGDELLSDFKIDRTSPEFKAELKKADSLGF